MNRPRPAVIAVASGKGGTGKTTVAVHLALVSSRKYSTRLLDLDVEAPDVLGYFPAPESISHPEPVTVAVPQVEVENCTGCGLCAKFCRFGAIIAIGGVVTIDERICKGCGRCISRCPSRALAEIPIEVGTTSACQTGGMHLLEGRMGIGDIRSTAVIEATKRRSAMVPVEVEVRDCPPGVSCPATHALEGADYVVLVAEPTEFSLHDLGAAVELVRGRGMPAGIVINKDGFGTADVAAFCADHGVPVIGRIAFSRSRASSGAAGRLWGDDIAFMLEMEKILVASLTGTELFTEGPV